MDYEIVIPRLGLTMETGRIVEWYKQDGESVRVGEPIFAVETDKAVQDISAEADGTVYREPAIGSEPLPIGSVVGHIRGPAGESPTRTATEEPSGETTTASPIVAVFMPKMSDFMEAGEIADWLVGEGSAVEKGQPILAVVTDKATVDLEAPASGILRGIREGVKAGANVPVGETIAFIAGAGDVVPVLPPLSAAATQGVKETIVPAASPGPSKPDRGPARASPSVRHLAKQLGIDLKDVEGTGPEGRITEPDVRRHAEAASSVSTSEPARGEADWLDLNPIQRLTGKRMLESVQSAPHFALAVDLDMTEVLKLRATWMDRVVEETGERLSITGILIKVAACALKRFPRANASFDAGRIKLHREINIGVAVGTEQGLVVPVVRNADRKSLIQITRELALFKVKATNLRFTTDDLAGGTFTVSNMGMYGVDRFDAIINPPESAIMATGRVVKRPAAMPDDTIALRPLMTLTLSIDHRSMDGVQGAKLLGHIAELVENPNLMFE